MHALCDFNCKSRIVACGVGFFANCVPQFCVCTYTQPRAVLPLLLLIHPTYLVASGYTPLLDKGRPRRSMFWPEILVSGSFSECLGFGECQSHAFFFRVFSLKDAAGPATGRRGEGRGLQGQEMGFSWGSWAGLPFRVYPASPRLHPLRLLSAMAVCAP